MIRGIYTAASGMLCQEALTQTVANNLANVNTAGFKRDKVIFRDFPAMLLRRINDPTKRIYEHKIDPMPFVGKLGTGAIVDDIYNDKSQGDFIETGNRLDLAIYGKGYFVVDTPNGPAFTRNGAFKIGNNGTLSTLDGFILIGRRMPAQVNESERYIGKNGELPLDASPIKIDENTKDIKITEDGSVYIDGEIRYRILLVDFENPERLLKRGKNLFFQNKDTGYGFTPKNTKIYQGKLERSNVSAIESMVNLIMAQRSYEANQKVVISEDTMLAKAVNELGKT